MPAGPDPGEAVLFCVLCFASEQDGSWHGGVVQNHCLNCGASGSVVVTLPPFAVTAIRKNASWVGKRYYPCDEDREIQQELRALRALVTEFPGRTARAHTDDYTGKHYWVVEQVEDGGRSTSMTFDRLPGESPSDGIEKSRLTMRYITHK